MTTATIYHEATRTYAAGLASWIDRLGSNLPAIVRGVLEPDDMVLGERTYWDLRFHGITVARFPGPNALLASDLATKAGATFHRVVITRSGRTETFLP